MLLWPPPLAPLHLLSAPTLQPLRLRLELLPAPGAALLASFPQKKKKRLNWMFSQADAKGRLLWMVAKSAKAPPFRNPMIRFPSAHANQQWFPMLSVWCEMDFAIIRSMSGLPSCKTPVGFDLLPQSKWRRLAIHKSSMRNPFALRSVASQIPPSAS